MFLYVSIVDAVIAVAVIVVVNVNIAVIAVVATSSISKAVTVIAKGSATPVAKGLP